MVNIIISIPKSGTHFLNEVLIHALDNNCDYSFSKQTFGGNLQEVRDGLNKVLDNNKKSNLNYLAHWAYSEELADWLIDTDYNVFFIYRHPLDVAVSFIEGALLKLFDDPIANKIRRINNKDLNYIWLLEGYRNIKHPNAVGLRKIIEERLKWAEIFFNVKYRHLYDINHCNKLQLCMSNLIGCDTSHLCNAVNEAKNTITKTFRNPGVDNWKNEMPEHIQNKYISSLNDLIVDMGFQC